MVFSYTNITLQGYLQAHQAVHHLIKLHLKVNFYGNIVILLMATIYTVVILVPFLLMLL